MWGRLHPVGRRRKKEERNRERAKELRKNREVKKEERGLQRSLTDV